MKTDNLAFADELLEIQIQWDDTCETESEREPLDGDAVDRLAWIIKCKLNLMNANITEEEYDELLYFNSEADYIASITEAPKVVAVVSGGVIQSVIGDSPVDLHVIDYDYEDEAPEDCHEIPQGDGTTETAYAYIGEIFEEDEERTKELIKSINR